MFSTASKKGRQSALVRSGLFRKEANIVDVPVTLGVVHAVADDELVGNLEADIVGLDGHKAPLRLVEAGSDLERGGLVLKHQSA